MSHLFLVVRNWFLDMSIHLDGVREASLMEGERGEGRFINGKNNFQIPLISHKKLGLRSILHTDTVVMVKILLISLVIFKKKKKKKDLLWILLSYSLTLPVC